jgi:hypothetical protein
MARKSPSNSEPPTPRKRRGKKAELLPMPYGEADRPDPDYARQHELLELPPVLIERKLAAQRRQSP